MSHLQDSFWDRNGFDELRKVMRASQDFCKDLSLIFSERAEIENKYSQSMVKLAAKASKATRNSWGTLQTAWEKIAESMSHDADAHKELAEALVTELSKPLKARYDQITKDRKPVETAVEKATKALNDQRSNETKAKQSAFSRSKDLEQAHEQLEEAQRGPKQITEKDIAKLEQKIKKAEDTSRKADTDYVEQCRKAEQARQAWEVSMYTCAQRFEEIEKSRTEFCKNIFEKYEGSVKKLIPELQQDCETIQQQTGNIDATADISTCCETSGTGPNVAEQILYDCWEEDTQTSSMDSNRRKAILEQRVTMLAGEVDKAQKVRKGIESLSTAYKGTPSFGGETAQEDVHRQICAADAMVDYFQASLFKLRCALAQVTSASKPNHRLSQFLSTTRNKQGTQISLLRVPLMIGGARESPFESTSAAATPVATPNQSLATASSSTNGTHHTEATGAFRDRTQSFYDDEDEFDDTPAHAGTMATQYEYIGQCRALYDYQGSEADELRISSGDVLNIITKQDENWWHGELNGKVGLFPATYVEEI